MTFPLERSGGKATGGWDGATAATQFEWLKKDLAAANANRDMVPWVVVHGHRSICEHMLTALAPQMSADIDRCCVRLLLRRRLRLGRGRSAGGHLVPAAWQ